MIHDANYPGHNCVCVGDNADNTKKKNKARNIGSAYAGSKFLHFVCQIVDECRTPDTNIRLSDQDSM